MQVLIVSATRIEIEPLMKARPDMDYCITGVGAAVATFAIANAVDKKKYDLLIQAGVGGSFNFKEVASGEVVVVKRDRFADLGVFDEGGFISAFEMKLAEENDFPFANGWLENEFEHFSYLPDKIKFVDAITVNAIHADERLNRVMRLKYHAAIESMEGAAFHYVCLQKNLSFLQLRAVSNLVGDRNKANWNILQAFENLSNSIQKILNTIVHEN